MHRVQVDGPLPTGKPKARLRGEKSLAFGPANDIRRVSYPQGDLRTDKYAAGRQSSRIGQNPWAIA